MLFEEGIPLQSFDKKDEKRALLDENGEPIRHGKLFKDNENEYDVICNAIQLGLNRLGEGTWDEIHKFVTVSEDWMKLT